MAKKTLFLWISGSVCAVLVLAYAGIAYYFSGIIVAFPVFSLEENKQAHRVTSFAEMGLPEPRNLEVPIEGGYIRGWLFEHPAPKPCGVVISHGHTGTRYGAFKYIPLFWRRGCDIVAMDARYHGASSGEHGTYGYREKHDLVAVVNWLARERSLRMNQIGLMGESMGAAISLQAAALIPELAFVGADSPFADLTEMITRQGTVLYGKIITVFVPTSIALANWRADADLSDVSPARYAERIQAPVFLQHSSQDALIPASHARVIFDAIPHDRKVLHITDWGAQHGAAINTRYGEYERYVDEFLARYVPAF